MAHYRIASGLGHNDDRWGFVGIQPPVDERLIRLAIKPIINPNSERIFDADRVPVFINVVDDTTELTVQSPRELAQSEIHDYARLISAALMREGHVVELYTGELRIDDSGTILEQYENSLLTKQQ